MVCIRQQRVLSSCRVSTRPLDVHVQKLSLQSYAWHPQIMDDDRLTGSLILVALTAGFGSLAFFSLLHSISDLRSGFCSFFLTVSPSFVPHHTPASDDLY